MRSVRIHLVAMLASVLTVCGSNAQSYWPKSFTRFGPISLDASKFLDVIGWLGPNEVRLDDLNSATAIQYLCFEFTTEKGERVFVAFEAPHNTKTALTSAKVNTLVWSRRRPTNRECSPTKTNFDEAALSQVSRTNALYFFGNGKKEPLPDRLLIYDRKTEQSRTPLDRQPRGRLKKISTMTTSTFHSFEFNQEELETLEISKWTFVTNDGLKR